ncbi:ABC transporter ATP-binding protein NatA [Pseudoalteromonas holothuriae]|uniref:ABC transporter ATP-binding protein NatA n=1 Tax=Pseudoalteromonas holothuriae TaxID=2963714 RepID=A0A9W4VT20_9GAMM|nr:MULTISPECIES: ATP-binding cassette domain-containing protein [unclassified Pseudoalteromonas]CAH9061712.1 ABC transporter ATP-binding protein NatA [Pseudoalteromonas sp. CIP111951]CAH9062000.1 ABC transporter ATP-binding protein NatA [Pseudoalteromonas sp. CIP111854]
MIEVKALKKRFKLTKEHQQKGKSKDVREHDGYFHSVQNVSFSCSQGEVLGLLGPNGAGKTTTLRMLSTALTPDSGHIHINGQNIVKKPLIGRKSIGFLSGSTGLYGRLSARENVEYFAKLHGLKGKTLKLRCEALFDMLDMTSFLDKRAEHLSTGMKQKASIARAVVHQPDVVVLDEPTTGLDIMTTQTVINFIRGLKNNGTPVIFSTHHLDEVALLCDRICVIDKGVSFFDDSIAQFKAQGNSEELNQAFMNLLQGAGHV